MKLYSTLILAMFSISALGKTKVEIPQFENKSAPGKCNVSPAWKDLPAAFQQQLITRLNEGGLFEIVEARLRGEARASGYGVSTIHKTRMFTSAQYSVVGRLKAFEACNHSAQVVLEISVMDAATGAVANTFESRGIVHSPTSEMDPSVKGAPFNTGLFKDSPLGKAAMGAVADAADKLKKAYPEREVASNGYKVRTIRRHRR
jgi:hypothetical protein